MVTSALKIERQKIETTAAGIDAETVIPANRPRYALAAPSSAARAAPKITAATVSSGDEEGWGLGPDPGA